MTRKRSAALPHRRRPPRLDELVDRLADLFLSELWHMDGWIGANDLIGRPLATLLSVSERTIETWRCRGVGPPYSKPTGKPGSVCFYALPDVLAWLDGRVPVGSTPDGRLEA